MAKKEFAYKGRNLEELKAMSFNEFAEIVPSSVRRKLKRGLTDQEKTFLEKLKKGKKNLKTQCRDMIIIPEMVGSVVKVHKGNEFVMVNITEEMISHTLGEFVLTRKRVTHSSPGVGATRSSSNISVK